MRHTDFEARTPVAHFLQGLPARPGARRRQRSPGCHQWQRQKGHVSSGNNGHPTPWFPAADTAAQTPQGHPVLKLIVLGRGSWIRTNDLQYPKLISHVSRSVLQLPQAAITLYLSILLAPQVS